MPILARPARVFAGCDGVVRFQGVESNLDPELTTRIFRDLHAKDPELYHHGRRVATFARILGGALGLKEERLTFLVVASWLHDLGKLHIPANVRFKRGRLTAAEYRVMQRHPRIGARMLRSMGAEGHARVALLHHEWYTGWGYPFGLNASELSVETQITSVADAYDAMTSGRSYCGQIAHDCAVAEIVRFSGIQFSPAVVAVLATEQDRIDEARGRLENPKLSDWPFRELVAAG